jgi:hypothetical protein
MPPMMPRTSHQGHESAAGLPWLDDPFQPQLFARQYAELKAEVRRLKQELDPPASWVYRIATACSFALLKRKASACC